ncbi:MAG: tyrosine-type recombinase/integrase [Acidobacteriota bacterium]|nr:tyrosine-type recombinase/integrase [Acidobacteriota bacterium]
MNPLRQALADYLIVRRALGFKLCSDGRALRRFVEYAEGRSASVITTELALGWAQEVTEVDPARWAKRLRMVRQFAQYCSAFQPNTEVPPKGLLPFRYRRQPPYLYSEGEILRLIEAAKRLPSRTGLRAATYSTLLGLMAVTGMRMSEPIGLDRGDVDFSNGVITIRRSKFGKSRCIPLHASSQEALKRYQRLRDELCLHPQTPRFFLSERGTRVTERAMHGTFAKLSQEIGLRRPSGHRGPRLHDLRHTFAVQALLGWYRQGLDVERQLPKLATYLGHINTSSTYWYLSATPELLQRVVHQLEDPHDEQWL